MFYYILILFNMPDIQKQMDLVIYEKKHTKEIFKNLLCCNCQSSSTGFIDKKFCLSQGDQKREAAFEMLPTF